VTELFEDELGLVVSPRHQLASAGEASVEEMRRARFILFEQGASIRRATDAFFKRVDLSPDLALESNDTYFIKLMVEHGVGVSLMPSWAVREEVEAGRLTWLRVAGHRLTRDVAVIALGRFQPSTTRAFIDYVLEHRERLQEAARPF
jgi:DNA-binding transcriptional LysR family regulator